MELQGKTFEPLVPRPVMEVILDTKQHCSRADDIINTEQRKESYVSIGHDHVYIVW